MLDHIKSNITTNDSPCKPISIENCNKEYSSLFDVHIVSKSNDIGQNVFLTHKHKAFDLI